MPSLVYLNISGNIIQSFTKSMFKMTHNLRILDISFNQVSVLGPYNFENMICLSVLDLRNNPIIEVSPLLFKHIKVVSIHTSSYKVCCVKPQLKTICNKYPPWPHSCNRLLVDLFVQVMMGLVGCTILLLNLPIYFLHCARKVQSCYNINVVFTSVGDFFFGIFLVSVVFVDIVYGNNYLKYEHYWRESMACYTFSVFSLISATTSCVFLSFMAFTRYLAVTKPFSIRNLTPGHVASILAAVFISVSLIAITLVVIYRLANADYQLPTGLCLMIGNLNESVISKIITYLTVIFQIGSSFSVTILYVLIPAG